MSSWISSAQCRKQFQPSWRGLYLPLICSGNVQNITLLWMNSRQFTHWTWSLLKPNKRTTNIVPLHGCTVFLDTNILIWIVMYIFFIQTVASMFIPNLLSWSVYDSHSRFGSTWYQLIPISGNQVCQTSLIKLCNQFFNFSFSIKSNLPHIGNRCKTRCMHLRARLKIRHMPI